MTDINRGKDTQPFPGLFSMIFLAATAIWLHVQGYSNPAHMDEYDYLFVGKNLLAGNDWPSLTYIFGADFNWYLYGVSERYLGGLNGARVLATISGVFSLFVVYQITLLVWKSRIIALFSALLLSVSAPHVFISHMASYDILSFTLFASSLYPLILCCLENSKNRYGYMVTGVVLFAAAVLSKYIVLIYMPLIGVLMLCIAPRIALQAFLFLGIILASYTVVNLDDLKVLYSNQIVGVHGVNTTRLDLLRLLAPTLVLPIILWLVGFVIICRSHTPDRTKHLKLYLLSLLLATPMVFYHLYSANMISQYKHVIYALLFLAPTSAWALVKVLSTIHSLKARVLVLVIVLLPLVMISSKQISAMQNGYLDSLEMLSKVSDIVNAETTILSEDPYVFRYQLFNDIPQSQINESGWFDYNEDGVFEAEDVQRALVGRHFELVLLNDQIHPHENSRYRELLDRKGYTLVHSVPYSLSNIMTNNRKGTVSLYHRERGSDAVRHSSFMNR